MINNDVDNNTNDQFASQMYLISADDFSLLTSVKQKGQSEPLLPQPPPPVPPPIPPPSVPPPEQLAESTSDGNNKSNAPMEEEETGQGKKKTWTKENVADFNEKFLSKKNLQRYLEDRDWEELYKRLLPILKSSNTNKAEVVNDLIQLDRDDEYVNLRRPFNPSDERTPNFSRYSSRYSQAPHPKIIPSRQNRGRSRSRSRIDDDDDDDDDSDDFDDSAARAFSSSLLKTVKRKPVRTNYRDDLESKRKGSSSKNDTKGKSPMKNGSSGPSKNTRLRAKNRANLAEVDKVKKNLANSWTDNNDEEDILGQNIEDLKDKYYVFSGKSKKKGSGRKKYIRKWVNF